MRAPETCMITISSTTLPQGQRTNVSMTHKRSERRVKRKGKGRLATMDLGYMGGVIKRQQITTGNSQKSLRSPKVSEHLGRIVKQIK